MSEPTFPKRECGYIYMIANDPLTAKPCSLTEDEHRLDHPITGGTAHAFQPIETEDKSHA